MIDKASLIQIPSGYKNGKLYSLKPNPTYGSELVVNGDFTTDSDWTKGSGWSIVNGEAVHTGSGDYIEQGSLVQGKNYRVVIVVTQASGSGFPQIYMGGLTTAMASPNTYTFDITAQSGDKIKLRGLNDCKVDSISVKEILVADGDFTFSRSSSGTRVNSDGLIETAQVLGSELITNGDFSNGGANWNYTLGVWDFSSGLASCNGTQSGLSYLNQSGGIVSGKKYKVTYEITSISAGEIRVFVGDVSGLARTTTGVFTEYITATSTNFWLRVNSTFVGSIDNVSVKEVIENDVPRLDYSGASCASLLLESQRTNLITYSESFSNSYWAKTRATISANQIVSPDGSVTADSLTATDTSENYCQQNVNSTVSGSQQTVSFFVKKGTSDFCHIFLWNVPNNGARQWFDLTSGSVGTSTTFGSTVSVDSAEMINYGNGWYRCIVVFNNSNTNIRIAISASNSNGSVLSTIGKKIYIWGAQLEVGSYPTSYIPSNSGSSTTRSADVCNNAGTSATFNDSEGVLFAEIAANALTSTLEMLSLSDGTYNNVVLFRYYDTSSNDIQVQVKVAGSAQASMLFTLTDATSFNKIALKYKAYDFALWVNGIEVATDTSGNTFSANTLNRLSFDRGDGGNDFYGKTKQLMVFDEALSDEELSDLTGQVNTSFAELANFYNYTIL